MNDIGKNCYSNAELRAEGRCISLADLMAKSNITIGTRIGRNPLNWKYYPSIHMFEEYSCIDGKFIKPGDSAGNGVPALNSSQQNDYIEATDFGATEGLLCANKPLTSRNTNVTSFGNLDSTRKEMIRNVAGIVQGNLLYFLASRAYDPADDYPEFSVTVIQYR